ncbi:MAG: TlyA family RNA methyltransferase [Firmicutes bacterium]|nr:TlyA family RNA methyltransferase [Bacillota bacterium]
MRKESRKAAGITLKQRLDTLLVEKGFFQSREKAKTSIMAGLVFVDGQISDKPGNNVDVDAEITVKGDDCPYVSRGGLKLEKALKVFDIDVKGFHCIDIGASTGGFTDCLLQNGAEKVYSVDVGYGQLDYKLRSDSRVVCMEKINFRYLEEGDIPEKLDFACADVSFISLKHMFPVAYMLLKEGASFASLIKPQFEAGREQVGKHGIIKDASVHREVIEKVIGYANLSGFSVCGLSFSPITGGKGNIEFLIYLKKLCGVQNAEIDIDSVVTAAHKELK